MVEADRARATVQAPPRSPWTRLAVDPLALPLGRALARSPWITPSRVTTVAVLCALVSATCFVVGEWRGGGLAFLARYFFDCVDGQVARCQGTGSRVGAAYDLMADIGGIAVIIAAAGWRLVTHHDTPVALPMALLAAVVYYNWILAHRKALAFEAGLEFGGGAGGGSGREVPGLRWWFALARRLGMTPIPWAIEVEIFMLGLGPLLMPEGRLPALLLVGLAFYLLANAVNTRRVLRIARDLDSSSAT